MINDFFLSIYAAASAGLLVYSLNCYIILGLFWRQRSRGRSAQRPTNTGHTPFGPLPVVTTQIPIYNEANVAERAIRAAAGIVWPRDRHEIQILDDSTDETRAIVDRTARELRARGHRIVVLRRADRRGFKAGALAHGLRRAAGELIAIFDADFLPPPNFLHATVPCFLHDQRLGLVQARWAHLNDADSLLTRAQAIGIDGHFVVEQPARTFNGLLMNFNGTAGIWRRAALDDAGGWTDDTLTEDLDVSYRAQLAGWRMHFLPGLAAPAELPATVAGFKSQQFRWAKGSIQTARKLLPRVWRSERSLWVKLQATLHLNYYAIHPLMLAVALLAAPLQWNAPAPTPAARVVIGFMIAFSMLAPIALCVTSQCTLYRDWWKRLATYPALLCIGVGVTATNTRGVLEALFGRTGEFVRTPKRGGQRGAKRYRVHTPVPPWIELALGAYCTASLVAYAAAGKYALAPFLAIYASGFLGLGFAGWRERYRAAPRPRAPRRIHRPAGARAGIFGRAGERPREVQRA
ncbi:MAG TPA: glycosyltransferase [Opitutus sp.]|nr:glycosyltransferase [Opitutus sp.]